MNNPKKSIKMSVTATTTEDNIFNPVNQLRALISKDASRDFEEFIALYYDHANRGNDTNSDRYGFQRTTQFQSWIVKHAPKYSIITGASMDAIETWMGCYCKDMAEQVRLTTITPTREWRLTYRSHGDFVTRFKTHLHSSLNASLNKAANQRIEQRENQSK